VVTQVVVARLVEKSVISPGMATVVMVVSSTAIKPPRAR
jgi:hypothetical protein